MCEYGISLTVIQMHAEMNAADHPIPKQLTQTASRSTWHSYCSKTAMFARIGISSVTEFLEVATLPIRTALGRKPADTNHPSAHKVALITETTDGVSVEKSICIGDLVGCCSAVVPLMQEHRKFVLDGFPLEDVAELCLRHNYRWRFCAPISSRNGHRFIIEPGKSLEGDAREVRS